MGMITTTEILTKSTSLPPSVMGQEYGGSQGQKFHPCMQRSGWSPKSPSTAVTRMRSGNSDALFSVSSTSDFSKAEDERGLQLSDRSRVPVLNALLRCLWLRTISVLYVTPGKGFPNSIQAILPACLQRCHSLGPTQGCTCVLGGLSECLTVPCPAAGNTGASPAIDALEEGQDDPNSATW